MVELTDEEKKNGWTEETLEKYFKDREKAQLEYIMADRRVKPRFAMNKYRPLHWRQG